MDWPNYISQWTNKIIQVNGLAKLYKSMDLQNDVSQWTCKII